MEKKSETRSIELSSNHRRVISVRMRSLEESAMNLLDLFRRPDSTLAVRLPLPHEKAAEVGRRVAELRDLVSRTKSELGLEYLELDARREAAALLADMTVNVEELDAHELKGYGSVPEELARYLRTRQREFLVLIKGIERLVRDPPTEAPPGRRDAGGGQEMGGSSSS